MLVVYYTVTQGLEIFMYFIKGLIFSVLGVLYIISVANAGPMSDFKASAVLSEDLTSSPTQKRNTPRSDSLKQALNMLDPENSEIWPELSRVFLGEKSLIHFENKVRIIMQDHIEEPHEVPLIVKLPKNLHNFKEFILLIENNPIQQVIRITPHRPIESIGMNVRLEDDSPVRAAIKDTNGIWHVGSKMVFVSSPGGCSSPACDPVTEICDPGEIGKLALKQYDREAGAGRLKIKIIHPMDTGFVSSPEGEMIPEYFIDSIFVDDIDGPIAELETYAALSADPVILIDLPEQGQSIRVKVQDSHGLEFFSIKDSNVM